MENSKNTGYILHDFMKEDLGLSGVALRVYALIYSFTQNSGDCYASLNNMAKRCAASTKSIQRALKYLTDMGYIKKTTNNLSSSNHYVADMSKVRQKSPEGMDIMSKGEDKMSRGVDIVTRGVDIVSNNNKEDNKEYIPTTTNNTYSLRRGGKPLVTMGNKKMLLLTLHEYANLLRVLGVVPTRRYMRNLENRIISHPRYNYDNHYQTIIDWARKDGYVVPAEQ